MTIVKYIRPLAILSLIFTAGLLKAQQKEPVDFVDPFIGTASVMTAVSPPSKGGVARLLLFESDEIYFRAGVVIAVESILTRIKNICPLL